MTEAAAVVPPNTQATQTPEQIAAAAAAAAATKTPEQLAAEKTAADAAAETARKAGEAAAAAAKPKAPEKYVLNVAEDGKQWVDEKDLTTIEAMARAEQWPNEVAQEVLDDHIKAMKAQSETFKAETLADATYGGEKLPETQKLALQALDRIRPAGTARGDNFRRLLGRTGYGNNLEIVSFLADLGKLMAEDMPLHAGGAAGEKRDHATVLYGEKKP